MRHFILLLSLMSCSLTVFGLTANIKVHGVVIAAPCEVEKNNYLIDLKKLIFGISKIRRNLRGLIFP
ncbi:hypothetical protein OOC_00630 [Providencia rettgeri Dmel1]|nr:hypothetical protein OOC_00630 [Providencia rettgeri Dmel1]